MLNNTFKEVNQNLRISLQSHTGGIGEKIFLVDHKKEMDGKEY